MKEVKELTNPPLAYVLAQVRFSPYLNIAKHIPSIQESLRSEYPGYNESATQTIAIRDQITHLEEIKRWEFTDIQSSTGIIIQHNCVVMHTTAYANSKVFFDKFKFVLETFQRIIPDILVERIGLRYVDLIVPSEGKKPEEYVTDSLKGIHLEGLNILEQRLFFIANLVLDQGLLMIRFRSQANNKHYLPEDLLPMDLAKSKIIQRANEAKDKKIGLLDFDRFIEERCKFDASPLIEKFISMHDDTSLAFRKIMSPLAKTEWE